MGTSCGSACEALGPVGGGMNPGQVYVTLSRLERAGLVEAGRSRSRRPTRRCTS